MVEAAADGWDVLLRGASARAQTIAHIAQHLPRLLLQVRYIGPRRARRLLDALGGDWREVLDLAPERVFRTLRGVGQSQARAAAESWAVLSRETAPPRQGRRGPPSERPIA